MAGVDSISNLSPEFQAAFRSASEAAARPITRMEERKGNLQGKVELLNDILGRVDSVKNTIPSLNTPIAIRELKVDSTDEKIIMATADKNIAIPGSHSLEINQLARPATALSNGFPDKNDTSIGTGYFSFDTLDGETVDVFIDAENGSLEGVARTINSANVGMRASVINDASNPDAPYRLLLSKDGTGSENDVAYPTYYFVDPDEDFYLEKQTAAVNAKVQYEGFDIESPTNQIKDLIPGVSLNLRGITADGKPESLTIGQDIPQTIIKMRELVDGINSIFSFIQEQNTIDENTPTNRTLGNDYGIRISEMQLKRALQTNILGPMGQKKIRALVDIGVSFNKNGTLDFDEKVFESSLDANFDEVVELLAGDRNQAGIMPRLARTLDGIGTPGRGVLANQRRNLSNQISNLDKKIERKSEFVQKKQERLKIKLTEAQNAINSIQSQGGFISQQIGSAGALTSLMG